MGQNVNTYSSTSNGPLNSGEVLEASKASMRCANAEDGDADHGEGEKRTDKAVSAFPSAREMYEAAKTVVCPFCDAAPASKCTPAIIFPQYPHTARIAKAVGLSEADWLGASSEQAKALVDRAILLSRKE